MPVLKADVWFNQIWLPYIRPIVAAFKHSPGFEDRINAEYDRVFKVEDKETTFPSKDQGLIDGNNL